MRDRKLDSRLILMPKTTDLLSYVRLADFRLSPALFKVTHINIFAFTLVPVSHPAYSLQSSDAHNLVDQVHILSAKELNKYRCFVHPWL
jgi:hypothetical protein